MTSQGCCAIIQTKLVTIALASTFTRMKTLVATLPFFLACLLLEMRNALLANGLKEFSRGNWLILGSICHSSVKPPTAELKSKRLATRKTRLLMSPSGLMAWWVDLRIQDSFYRNPRWAAFCACLIHFFYSGRFGRFGRFAAHSEAKKQTAAGIGHYWSF